ncbi:MAG: branched-chain amino acid ABC transporter permease [Microthrixaceae bacterium]
MNPRTHSPRVPANAKTTATILAFLMFLVCTILFGSAQVAGAQEPAPTPTTTSKTTPTTTPAPVTQGTVEPTAPAEQGGPRVTSTLKLGGTGKPIAGVEMVVSLDGKEVGRSASDENGFVAVTLPGGGKYEVTLDKSTLPKDVQFEEGALATLKPSVQASGDRPLIFRLVNRTHVAESGPSTFERLASLLASGTRFGLIIALAAVGLSLIFGTTGLTNFAHGELLTFGAIATWYLNSNNGGLGLPLFVAAIGGLIAAAAFGASFELGVYRHLRRRGMPIVSQMVVSIGLALSARYLFSVIFGANSKQFSQYAAQAPSIELGPVSLRPKDLIISAIALVALIAVGLFLQKARLGTAIRAVADNPDLAIASGINDKRVILMVWTLAGTLGGLAGIMMGSAETVQWTMGEHILLIMFAAVLLGGLGTTFGAMVGGLFVGIVSDLSTFWLDSDLKIVVALATLVAVLLIKPSGVFGVQARKA